jgi:hypothetical protein
MAIHDKKFKREKIVPNFIFPLFPILIFSPQDHKK